MIRGTRVNPFATWYDMADAVEPVRHGVQQEPPHELIGGERHRLGLAVVAVVPWVKTGGRPGRRRAPGQPAVGDGDAVGVAAATWSSPRRRPPEGACRGTRHHRAGSGAPAVWPAPPMLSFFWSGPQHGAPAAGRPSHGEIGRVRGRFRGKSVGSAATPREQRRPKRVDLYGEPGGTRTHDPKIKSLVLYHLSYGLAGTRRTAGRLERQAAPRVKRQRRIAARPTRCPPRR